MLAGHTGPDGRQTGGYIQNRWQGNELPQYAELSEFVPKAAIKWTIDDDKMVYASYSVGYRPGGINRTNKNTDWTRTLWGQQWSPDELTNYEVGLRSRWADDSLQLNVTGFYMAWDDYIHQAVDPSQVKDLVYGAIFTRGPQELRNTAIFVSGSDVPAGVFEVGTSFSMVSS